MPRAPRDIRIALAAFAIEPLPATVRQRLLDDDTFSSKLGIKPKRWFRLDDESAAESESLHKALRTAVDGGTSAALSLRGRKRANVQLHYRTGGTVAIGLNDKTYTFENTDPLSSDRPRRQRGILRVLAENPLLHNEEDEWLALVPKREITGDEYMNLMSEIAQTPEALHEQLQRPQELDTGKLVPKSPLYFERLVGPRPTSGDFHNYIVSELQVARRNLLNRHRDRALRRLAFTALWQPLVPIDLLSSIRIEEVKSLLDAEDPYSLLFGFELCRIKYTEAAYVDLGCSFLKKLLLDEKRSMARCNVFSAAALVAIVMIRRVRGVERAPLYWTRLAALAHAGVLANALSQLPDAQDFWRWASQRVHHEYGWYSAVDRREAPRWKPDWIDPEQIYAELAGRVLNIVELIPSEARPSVWVSALHQAVAKLEKEGLPLQMVFPGPFDDYNDAIPPSSSKPIFKEVERQLQSATLLSEAPNLFALAYSTRCSEEVVADVLRILNSAVDSPIAESRDEEPAYLSLCAYIAATARSSPIAVAVANRCLAQLQLPGSAESAAPLLRTMVEGCAAALEPGAHRRMVGEVVANTCFAINDDRNLASLQGVIDLLGARDRQLIPHLAKAQAVIRMKRQRS